MNRNRKNGKPASCEPCRIHKIRCDHAQPVCGRCQRRGKTCYYHPAPLTRPKSDRAPSSANSAPSVNGSNGAAAGTLLSPGRTPTIEALDRPILDARASFHPGHLGPASYAATFDGDNMLSNTPSNDSPAGDSQSSCSNHIDASRIHATLSVIKGLSYFPLIDRLVRAYYDASQAATIASPFILNALDAIQPVYRELSARGSKGPTEEFISKLLHNTAQPINLAKAATPNEIHLLYTGENLCLEIIGVLFAIAGRTRVFGLGRDATDISFADHMLTACDTILRLYDDSFPTNELVVWLLYETTMLTMSRLGDANPKVWTRLGNLSTAVYALGIHREPTETDDPFFVLESRRKTFAAAYQLDKSISTFLGRPPRICWRHCSMNPPLDLCDNEMILQGDALAAAKAKLDVHGWSPAGVYNRATWVRCRYLVSIPREDILDFSLMPASHQTVDNLRELAKRCDDTWNSMPPHLHYDDSCWAKGIDSQVCIMLILVWMSHLHSKFLIQRLFCKLSYDEEDADLLHVSLVLLQTVLSMGKQRDRLVNFHRDFAWVMLLYGLPSAGVLAARLQANTRTGKLLPVSVSRADLIRNLSVFVSYLDGISSPGDGNFGLCSGASKILSGVLDEALNFSPANPQQAAGAPFSQVPTPEELLGPASLLQGVSALGDPDYAWNSEMLGETFDYNVISAQFVI